MRFLVTACLLPLLVSTASAEGLQLNQGDHVCLVGNALAERMQHYGWLETVRLM